MTEAVLHALGWDERWSDTFAPYAGRGDEPGRVAARHRGAYDVLTATGERRVRVTASLRRAAAASELPAVGDWVALDAAGDLAAVLPRRTAFTRRAAGARGTLREQVVAANVDVVLVTFPVDAALDPLVLERYAALAHESGARPELVLTKADLRRAARGDVDTAMPKHVVSARTAAGLDGLRATLREGVTAALVGPSGAGKSTLVNALAGDDALETGALAADGSGRHTTTRRQLVLLPGGGMLIDNPGMREVHMWLAADGIAGAFPDVVELAGECRFSDCRHASEPGCAVRAAVRDGLLAADRLARYLDLRSELDVLEEGLTRRARAGRGRTG